MKHGWWVALALVVAAVATAEIKRDTKLYIRAKNTNVKKSPDATAETVAVLQPGSTVTYVKKAPGATGWHQIQSGQDIGGFVYQANLSTTPPNMEIVGSEGNRSVSPEAFASSGAATKALSEGAIRYGTATKPDYERAVKDIQRAEALAKEVTDQEMAAHESETRLHPMVGVASGATP